MNGHTYIGIMYISAAAAARRWMRASTPPRHSKLQSDTICAHWRRDQREDEFLYICVSHNLHTHTQEEEIEKNIDFEVKKINNN